MKNILILGFILISLNTFSQTTKDSINNLNSKKMDVTLGDGAPIYFIVFDNSTKEIQPNVGVITGTSNLEDNSSAPRNSDGSPKYTKVTSTSKQKILDYVAAEGLQDPNDYLSQLY